MPKLEAPYRDQPRESQAAHESEPKKGSGDARIEPIGVAHVRLLPGSAFERGFRTNLRFLKSAGRQEEGNYAVASCSIPAIIVRRSPFCSPFFPFPKPLPLEKPLLPFLPPPPLTGPGIGPLPLPRGP